MRVHNFVACVGIALAACGGAPVQDDPSGPPIGTQGMVSTHHPIATESGLATLRKGGNAGQSLW